MGRIIFSIIEGERDFNEIVKRQDDLIKNGYSIDYCNYNTQESIGLIRKYLNQKNGFDIEQITITRVKGSDSLPKFNLIIQRN